MNRNLLFYILNTFYSLKLFIKRDASSRNYGLEVQAFLAVLHNCTTRGRHIFLLYYTYTMLWARVYGVKILKRENKYECRANNHTLLQSPAYRRFLSRCREGDGGAAPPPPLPLSSAPASHLLLIRGQISSSPESHCDLGEWSREDVSTLESRIITPARKGECPLLVHPTGCVHVTWILFLHHAGDSGYSICSAQSQQRCFWGVCEVKVSFISVVLVPGLVLPDYCMFF